MTDPLPVQAYGIGVMDQRSSSDGFFTRHPRLTMAIVSLVTLVAGTAWIVSAVRSGEGAHSTVDGSPVLFWAEIACVGVISLYPPLLALTTVTRRTWRAR